MSRFVLGNLFLLLSMSCAAASQMVTKALMNELPGQGLGWRVLREFLTTERILRGGLAVALLVAGYLFWLLSLHRLDLSYAYPVACSSILLVALLSTFFLGETMTARMWMGAVMILVGIALLMPRS